MEHGKNVEYLDRGSGAVQCACKCVWLKPSLFPYMGVCQRVMIMLNHLVQVQVGSAGSQRDIIFIPLK